MSSVPHAKYYVYILARPNGKPFYVGKGAGNRIYEHDGEARKGHKCHKCNVIRKIWKQGGEFQRYIVLTTDDEQEAFAHERELIALYGRENLCNLTDGGEGCSGRQVSAETREKMRKARKGVPSPLRGSKQSPEWVRNRSAALRGRKESPEVVEAKRQRALGTKQNLSPEQRAAKAAQIRQHGRAFEKGRRTEFTGADLSPEQRARVAESLRAHFAKHPQQRYEIVLPTGDVIECINLTAFCKERGLNVAAAQLAIKQDRPYRGHRIRRLG